MAPKRDDRVAPPPARGRWDLRYANSDTVRGWDELCRQSPGPTLEAWETLTRDPRDRSQPHRLHRLRGDLGTHAVKGRELEQWQYEVTGAGRLWFCVDDGTHTVWLTAATTGHPKQTE